MSKSRKQTYPGRMHIGICQKTGKRQYTDRQTAKAVVRELRNGLHLYLCEFCDFFHVGHGRNRTREWHRNRAREKNT